MSEEESESESGSESEPGVLGKAYRTVSPRYEGRPLLEMDLIGWSMLLGLLILLVPLLPFVVLVWAITKVLEMLSGSSEETGPAE
jgi:hypothetical protein